MCLGVALTLPYTSFLALTTAKVCLVFGLYSVHMMMAVVIERPKGRPGDSLNEKHCFCHMEGVKFLYSMYEICIQLSNYSIYLGSFSILKDKQYIGQTYVTL